MKRSTDRILVTHQGTLPKPEDLREMIAAKSHGQPYDRDALARRTREAVAEAVQHQIAIGIDCVNDGEMSKTSFSDYVSDRFGGIEPTPTPYVSPISGRDLREFPEYFEPRGPLGGFARGGGMRRVVFSCTGPLTYTGQDAVQTDIANLKAALEGVQIEEAYLPAVAPGSIEHWLKNSYYPSEEAYLYALADAMHEEYRAIVDAGFVLQIDDPDLADGWQVHPDLTVPEYRKVAQLRTEVLNHALRDIPSDRVRLHMCWGSYHGPHRHDLPLREFIDIVLSAHVGAFSIECSNPAHEWEWDVWRDQKLPDGTMLIPGVVGHFTDFIEHPILVGQRIQRYTRTLGRENVIAGTDCGLGTRVGHPKICWAKLESLVEGARRASRILWG
jgi:5-methyltetrahydropteroyltriglutamate--homocysteine methyltransferase